MRWIEFDFDTAPKNQEILAAIKEPWGCDYSKIEKQNKNFRDCVSCKSLINEEIEYYLEITPPNEEKESMQYL